MSTNSSVIDAYHQLTKGLQDQTTQTGGNFGLARNQISAGRRAGPGNREPAQPARGEAPYVIGSHSHRRNVSATSSQSPLRGLGGGPDITLCGVPAFAGTCTIGHPPTDRMEYPP
jgi:hypothetical protein